MKLSEVKSMIDRAAVLDAEIKAKAEELSALKTVIKGYADAKGKQKLLGNTFKAAFKSANILKTPDIVLVHEACNSVEEFYGLVKLQATALKNSKNRKVKKLLRFKKVLCHSVLFDKR